MILAALIFNIPKNNNHKNIVVNLMQTRLQPKQNYTGLQKNLITFITNALFTISIFIIIRYFMVLLENYSNNHNKLATT